MAIAFRRVAERANRWLVLLLLVLPLSGAIVAAHTGVPGHHMDGAMAMCVAVATAVAVMVATAPVLGRLIPALPRPVDAQPRTDVRARPSAWLEGARGSPAWLQVFRL
jgi:ethanolamine transporter EutH